MRRRNLRRNMIAWWRDIRVLFRQFRVSLVAFVILICAGTVALRLFYVHPDSGTGIGWAEALYATFMFIFAEITLPFPQQPGLQALFFLIPPVGLAIVADGLLRFGVALFNFRERKEAWQVAVASTYRNHIIVCGLGRIGYRVVSVLLRLGEEVVGIEKDPTIPFLDELRQMRVPVLVGDARQREMLEQARVREANAIVVCTQDDLTNLAIALEARELNPGIKVVLRMFDPALAEKVQKGFGIHTAFSASALAAPAFAAAATRACIDYSFYVGDLLMNVAHTEVKAGSLLDGRTIDELERELDISIIMHKRMDAVDMHPAPEVKVRPGDSLVILASLEALARFQQMSDVPSGASSPHTALPSRPRRFWRRVFPR
ncbi:MAG: NAD-binding protein [Anaerolineae bacterium]|nr:NAD-binding protein [Anaerolineae bacterium]